MAIELSPPHSPPFSFVGPAIHRALNIQDELLGSHVGCALPKRSYEARLTNYLVLLLALCLASHRFSAAIESCLRTLSSMLQS